MLYTSKASYFEPRCGTVPVQSRFHTTGVFCVFFGIYSVSRLILVPRLLLIIFIKCLACGGLLENPFGVICSWNNVGLFLLFTRFCPGCPVPCLCTPRPSYVCSVTSAYGRLPGVHVDCCLSCGCGCRELTGYYVSYRLPSGRVIS